MPAPKLVSKLHTQLPPGSSVKLLVSGGEEGSLKKGSIYKVSPDRSELDDWQVNVIAPEGLYVLDTYCLEVIDEDMEVDA